MAELNLTRKDYVGLKSTLCTGCGHDSITNHLITALFEAKIAPWDVAKMSGIGCSAKTTAYFLNQSHGINFLHGRMAPLATGVHLANRKLKLIGISGDGDSMSIGIGGLAHLIRRNVPMLYIVENNGVYGLTKGQFSATADLGSTLKTGQKNSLVDIDVCQFALNLGATFVARAFSGDKKQMVPLLKAALHHQGSAIIDIISPCVTFNNHEGSTRSFDAAKEHNHILQELGFISAQEEIEADVEAGESQKVRLHDGSHITLKPLDPAAHDVSSAEEAWRLLHNEPSGVFHTGLLYVNEQSQGLADQINLADTELARLKQDELTLSDADFESILSEFA